MNQDKIGKFIAERRKKQNLTQSELAEKLNITDRAVSKWERGLNLPDASLMIDLCKILDINVNELLSGEIIKKESYMEKAEENLIELKRQNERHSKHLLVLEIVLMFIGITAFIPFIVLAEQETNTTLKITYIVLATIILAIAIVFSFVIETEAGYHECAKCHHRYKPTYKQTIFSMHMGWTKYMKCPHCGEKSWSKKRLSK